MVGNLNYPKYADTVVLDRAFDQIAKALVDGEAQFLFGAGMSASSDMPTGKDLLRELLKLFFPLSGKKVPTDKCREKLLSDYPFEAIVEATENNLQGKRDDLTKFLSEQLIRPGYAPSQAHHDFVSICYWGGELKLDRVFTVNFDDILERGIGEKRTRAITQKNSKNIKKAWDSGLIPVIHLHGTLDDSYEITEKEIYHEYYRMLEHEFITALTNSSAFVFVGYSMNDPDFRRVFLNYRQDIHDRAAVNKTTYVVSPVSDKPTANDEFSYQLGREIWKARGAVWIPLDAKYFFAKLKNVMVWHSDMEARNIIKNKYGIEDENEVEEMIKRMAKSLRMNEKEALYFIAEYGPSRGDV